MFPMSCSFAANALRLPALKKRRRLTANGFAPAKNAAN